MPKEPNFEKPIPPSSETLEQQSESAGEKVTKPESQKEEVVETTEKQEDISPETQKEAEQLDRELAEGIGKQLKENGFTPEQATLILQKAKELSPQDKADIVQDLRKWQQLDPEERAEKETVQDQYQEAISKYEGAIDNLVERARVLGIEVSSEQLHALLEQFRNIEPESQEAIEWTKYVDGQLEELSGKVSELENDKKTEKSDPEKRKQIERDFAKAFGELIAKLVEYAVRLAIAITKGLIKGVVMAFRGEG